MTAAGPGRADGRWAITAVLLLAAVALRWAWFDPWLCDDAFVSFRYAEQWLAGHGLVFNPGERVEGYSNPLWVWLLAACGWFGADLPGAAQVLGALSFAATVGLLGWAACRGPAGRGAVLPVAALAVLGHHHLSDFATCGLETSAFVLATTGTALALRRAASGRDFLGAALWAVVAALLRPDGALWLGLVGWFALGASLRQRRVGAAFGAALPGLGLFLPFLLWRHAYYGDWLPNTFYAKSASDPYPGQGWFYVQLFLGSYWVLWPIAALLPVLCCWRRGTGRERLALMALAYLGFVVWVGGDFMFARFCLPVVPILYLLAEDLVAQLPGKGARWLTAAVVVGGTFAWHERSDLGVVGQTVRGIADEHAQYPRARTEAIRKVGRRLGTLLGGPVATGGVPVRVAFSGTQAMLVYEAKVDYALEAVTGLTDRHLARQVLVERGHVGHEKGIFRSAAATDYALTTQRVHLFLFDWPELTAALPFLRLSIDGTACTVVRWDPAVMARLLGQPGVEATDLPAWLDAYLAAPGQRPPAEVAGVWQALERVYFRWVEDPARRERLRALLPKG
ncbi:MAG: hypothetical protein JNK49_20370 [Planctomycetes bacterium]|nr:hypothetical protein [Planctomycetota bacterium]